MSSGTLTQENQTKGSFTLTVDDRQVATLTFNLADSKVNTFSPAVIEELEKLIDTIAPRTDITAMLILSGKKDNFIAGADLKSFIPALHSRELAAVIIEGGHRLFNKISALPFPTIAVIHGSCLGGGLEFALACSYRLATDHPKTLIGLPEVSLGIIPGWGGTQRLPRLIGLAEGLSMIISGKPINGKKAYDLHLADKLIAREFQEEGVAQFLKEISTPAGRQRIKALRQQSSLMQYALEGNPLGRQLLFNRAHKALQERTKGQYSAPEVALELIKKSYPLPLSQGLRLEIETFLDNIATGLSQGPNLINFFFTQEAVKKETWGLGEPPLRPIKSVAVIGAGTMGSGIAWLSATHDVPVHLQDLDWKLLGHGTKHIYELLNKGISQRKLTRNRADIQFQRVIPTVDSQTLKGCDLAIEAIIENLETKRQLFGQLEEILSPEAIIASNTSSLTVETMSQGLAHPERFVGLHFFNPVNKMPLVEVVPGKATSASTVATVVALCRQWGKTAIVVGDCPGFLVNRIFIVTSNEVLWMLQEGVPMAQIERAWLQFGMPMSPFQLSDEVGNDIAYKATKQLESFYGERMRCPDILQKIYDNKLLGKKCGEGFYLYDNRSKQPQRNPAIDKLLREFGTKPYIITDKEIMERILRVMANEASRCLDEKIIANEKYLNLALITGMGYPPYRPGILQYRNNVDRSTLIS
jgi:3-hydroxyacyl-CoA dehydrogenase/enoyl-CoA hydratase/3-hydroxybutyryl-CoA epimerase